MALRKTYRMTGDVSITGEGWSVSDGKRQIDIGPCYIKVQSIEGNRFELSVDVSVSSDQGSIKRVTTKFTPTLEGDNFIKQAYEHLKTLPEFAGAEDC